MIRQCLSEWFGSNSHSTWDIFIHTNWSGGLVHRLPSGFTIPPACTILWTCWTVMIKLSGSLPEALFFLDTRRLKVLEQRSRPGCFSQQTKTNLMSSRAQTPLTLTSVTCSEFFLKGLTSAGDSFWQYYNSLTHPRLLHKMSLHHLPSASAQRLN